MKKYKAHQLIKKLNSFLCFPNGTFIKTYDSLEAISFGKIYIHELIIFNGTIYFYDKYAKKGFVADPVPSSIFTWVGLIFEIQPNKFFTKEQAEAQFGIVIKEVDIYE